MTSLNFPEITSGFLLRYYMLRSCMVLKCFAGETSELVTNRSARPGWSDSKIQVHCYASSTSVSCKLLGRIARNAFFTSSVITMCSVPPR